jgi:hypothetical protein
MRIRGYLGLVIGAVMMLSGCSSAKLSVIKNVSAPPKTVSLKMNDKAGKKMPESNAADFQDILKDRLESEGIRVVPENKDVLAIVGDVNSYDEGSRALRYIVGFGAGTGRVDSTWQLLHPEGEVLGKCDVEGKISGGFMGGSISNMHKDVAKEVVNFVKGEN